MFPAIMLMVPFLASYLNYSTLRQTLKVFLGQLIVFGFLLFGLGLLQYSLLEGQYLNQKDIGNIIDKIEIPLGFSQRVKAISIQPIKEWTYILMHYQSLILGKIDFVLLAFLGYSLYMAMILWFQSFSKNCIQFYLRNIGASVSIVLVIGLALTLFYEF